MILTAIATLDDVLEANRHVIGRDYAGYRHHAYRVANLCWAQAPGDRDQLEKVAVAAAFHDLGIWTALTFDYVAPSEALARDYLSRQGHDRWADEVAAMIRDHHKITPSRAEDTWLVEPFRRADWIDVTGGQLVLGPLRALTRQLYGMWPSAGFHAALLRLEIARLRTHPLNPLPMLKW